MEEKKLAMGEVAAAFFAICLAVLCLSYQCSILILVALVVLFLLLPVLHPTSPHLFKNGMLWGLASGL